MQLVASVAAVLGMAAFAQAHMAIISPPPLRSSHNKFTTNVDYDMTSPLTPGSDYLCKGSLPLLGTPQAQSVADWPAGSQQTITIGGSAWHSGGSCQASLSYDKGKTWTVIHSWLGSCPTGPTPDPSTFTVPADAPAGEAIFAWSWFNKVGNREMYMNCAIVTIKGGASKKRRGVGFSSRPKMFVANVGNGCGTTEGTDLQFPEPGPDVTTKAGNFGPPTGKCAGYNGGELQPPPAQGPGPEKPSSSAAAAPSAPASSSPTPVPAVPTNTQQPKPSSSLPGGVFIPTSSASAPAAPTTIQTSIRPTQSVPVASPSAPGGSASQPPAAQPTAGAYAPGEKCQDLGAWNCIGGNQFQRCGAGNMWSAPQALAAGTSCKPGVAKDIVFA